ncbi:hypothetical protein [Paenibacillus sp. FSL L8-0641]|uniref:hypothetical protein n=1 Tax=Paenibacillus sp. FSL L8-0641 TaxID=2921605 RepID=UPI0030FA5DBA
MQSRQMSENYVNATLSDLNDLTNAILSNPDVQSTLETKPELRQIAKSAVCAYEGIENMERPPDDDFLWPVKRGTMDASTKSRSVRAV